MTDDGSSIRSFPLKEVYLEMTHRPNRPPAPHRGEKLALMRVERPVPSFYRYLYNTVGAPWLWFDRRVMDDDTLCDIVHHHKVEVYVLYVGGNPAGFVELDCRASDDIEIALLGLLPEFIGRGLGHYLLDWAVDEAWDKEPERVWVHSCNLDHPHARSSPTHAYPASCRRARSSAEIEAHSGKEQIQGQYTYFHVETSAPWG
jgi:GNAT superfamily N-acetyltransferase